MYVKIQTQIITKTAIINLPFIIVMFLFARFWQHEYEETLKAWYEQEDRLIDLRNQIQDLNYEKLSYKLELEVIINDNELKELDYYFNKMEGDIEKAVEAFGLLKDKMEVTKDSLADYENHVTELEAAYAAGEIS